MRNNTGLWAFFLFFVFVCQISKWPVSVQQIKALQNYTMSVTNATEKREYGTTICGLFSTQITVPTNMDFALLQRDISD